MKQEKKYEGSIKQRIFIITFILGAVGFLLTICIAISALAFLILGFSIEISETTVILAKKISGMYLLSLITLWFICGIIMVSGGKQSEK